MNNPEQLSLPLARPKSELDWRGPTGRFIAEGIFHQGYGRYPSKTELKAFLNELDKIQADL